MKNIYKRLLPIVAIVMSIAAFSSCTKDLDENNSIPSNRGKSAQVNYDAEVERLKGITGIDAYELAQESFFSQYIKDMKPISDEYRVIDKKGLMNEKNYHEFSYIAEKLIAVTHECIDNMKARYERFYYPENLEDPMFGYQSELLCVAEKIYAQNNNPDENNWSYVNYWWVRELIEHKLWVADIEGGMTYPDYYALLRLANKYGLKEYLDGGSKPSNNGGGDDANYDEYIKRLTDLTGVNAYELADKPYFIDFVNKIRPISDELRILDKDNIINDDNYKEYMYLFTEQNIIAKDFLFEMQKEYPGFSYPGLERIEELRHQTDLLFLAEKIYINKQPSPHSMSYIDLVWGELELSKRYENGEISFSNYMYLTHEIFKAKIELWKGGLTTLDIPKCTCSTLYCFWH